MDDVLVAIAQAAEKEQARPPLLYLLAGNSLFVGTPAPSKSFVEASQTALGEGFYDALRPKKKEMEAAYQSALSQATIAAQPLHDRPNGDDGKPTAITLVAAQVWPASGGDGVELPAVRVPLAAVDGWWIGGGKKLSAGGGAGFFVGGIFPIDN